MRKFRRNTVISLIILLAGIGLLYFNSIYTVCPGWNILNPFCSIGAALQHTILFWGGIVLSITGIYRLIKG